MTSTLEIGKRLVELCKQQKFLDAINGLYGPDVVSVEVRGDENMPARMEGFEAVRGKSEWWVANHEVHGVDAMGPFPHGDRFIVFYKIDVTPKAGPTAGKRMTFEEAGLYTVKDGKIVHEEFFYEMHG